MDFRPFRNGVVLLNHFGAAPWNGHALSAASAAPSCPEREPKVTRTRGGGLRP